MTTPFCDAAGPVVARLKKAPGCPAALGHARHLIEKAGAVHDEASARFDAVEESLAAGRALLHKRQEELTLVMEDAFGAVHAMREALAASQKAVEGLPVSAGA